MAFGISQLENRNWNFKGSISVNGTEVVNSSGEIKADIKDTLAQGSMYVGDASNITSEVDFSGDAKIPIGNGTTVASKSISGDITLTNTGLVNVQNAQNGFSVTKVDDSAVGAVMNVYQNSASPAASDEVGSVNFAGNDDGANITTYGLVSGKITDPTDGAEIGEVTVQVQNGTGSLVEAASFSHDGSDKILNIGHLRTKSNVGTPGTNVTAVEYGYGAEHTTVLTLANADLGAIGGAGNLALGALIYTFPAGAHLHSVTYGGVDFQGDAAIQADTPDFGVGSVIGSGAVAVLGGTATFEDYIAGSAANDCNGTPNAIAMAGATAGIYTGISLNQPADVKAVHVNAAFNWSGASASLLASGTVVLKWSWVGP